MLGQARKGHNENLKIRGQCSVVDFSFYIRLAYQVLFLLSQPHHTTSLNSNPEMVSLLYSNTSLFPVGFFAEDLFVALAGLKLTFWVRVVLNFLHLPPNYEHDKYVLSCSVNLMY